jgi:hypothetical protein
MAIKLTGNPAAMTGAVFVVGDDHQLYEIEQVAPNDGWSAWISRGAPPGATLYASPAVSLKNFIDVYVPNPVVVGTDHGLYGLPQHDGGDAWEKYPVASLLPSPAVAEDSNSFQYVFAVDFNGELIIGDGVTGQFSSHPGAAVGPTPVVAASQDGRLEVFARGNDGALWHIWQTDVHHPQQWSSWFSHGASPGGATDNPALAAGAGGELQLFLVAADGALWGIHQTAPNNGWSGWISFGQPPGGPLQGSPALGASQDGRLELFVVAADGALWHRWQTNVMNPDQWSSWFSHGRPPGSPLLVSTSAPTLTASQDGRLELFVVASDGALWHIWQTQVNNGWSPWFSHGTP